TSNPLGGVANFSVRSSFSPSPGCATADAIRQPSTINANAINRIIGYLACTRSQISCAFEVRHRQQLGTPGALTNEAKPGKQVLLSARVLWKVGVEKVVRKLKPGEYLQRLQSAVRALEHRLLTLPTD